MKYREMLFEVMEKVLFGKTFEGLGYRKFVLGKVMDKVIFRFLRSLLRDM